ncbi:eukaryotic translation initiation factor 4 gamma 3-like isoform X2 [Synchiropus splendidus]|uniref:eukaryotic translation initiation factor 4 gamma 3-like isoform X2 n=1 Tax=Synchiropus splendidus TaxID=270530 RepID=UPI00237DEC65|nr:eukaryotic translation initiation factor 4 gamma 3-like isoform X2 [Synchiropus splendidus]
MMQHRDKEPREENGWAAPEKTLDKEQFKTQELLKQFFLILNVMSSETLKQLVKRAKRLRVDTEERLRGVINIIQEKAMSEPSRSEAYAKMCCHLIGISVQSSTEPGGLVTFQKLLLHQCLTAFENVHDRNMQTEREEEKWCVPEELEEARAEAKKRFEGNIKFVGELFKVKLIKVAIMHEYVSRLLNHSDEVSLEGLCQLLHAIGKDLDLSREKQVLMDQHFSRMDRIVTEGRSSPRISYMLQDVMNLRKNQWVTDGAETSTQNHRSAEQVKQQRQDVPFGDSRFGQRSRWKRAQRRRDRFRQSSSGEQDAVGEIHCQNKAEEPRHAEEQLRSAGAKKISENVETGESEFSEELEERKDGSPEVISQVDTQIRDECDSSKTVESVEFTEESVKHEASPTEGTTQEETELQNDSDHQNSSDSSDSLKVPTVESGKREVRPTEVTTQAKIQDDSDHQNTSQKKTVLGEELQEDVSAFSSAGQTQEDSTVQDIPGDQHTAESEFLEEAKEKKHSSPEDTSVEVLEQVDHQSSKTVESEVGPQVQVQDDEQDSDSAEFQASAEQNGKLRVETRMSSEDLTRHLDSMIQRQASNREISDWIEENLDPQQTSSSTFVRSLMTCICRSAISYQKIYKVDIKLICLRRRLLWKYVEGEEKELQALYALQALMVGVEPGPRRAGRQGGGAALCRLLLHLAQRDRGEVGLVLDFYPHFHPAGSQFLALKIIP